MAGNARLLKASLSGDHDAFARIVRRYQALVCAITYSATGDVAASEDLAQETFLSAWKGLASLRDPSRLRAWLCGIARNLTAEHLRRRQHDVQARAASVEDVPAVESALPTPLEQATAKEREHIVWDALRAIPETYRVPLVLYYREEQSTRRVARDLQISSATVRQRLARGRQMLRGRVAALVEDTLSTTAPGGTFAAAVLAGLGATAAEKAAGASYTILGLSLAKAAAVGLVVAGAVLGAAAALPAEAPGPVTEQIESAVPAEDSEALDRPAPLSPEQMGQEFLKQQAGVDEATSFLLEWEESVMRGDGARLSAFSVAWQGRRIYWRLHWPQDGSGITWVGGPDQTVGLTLRAGQVPSASLQAFASVSLMIGPGLARSFFPVAQHWWDNASYHAFLEAKCRQHPERFRRAAEALSGKALSADEALDVARELYNTLFGEHEFCAVPPDIHRSPPGRLAVAARCGHHGWFSILEFDSESRRLMRLITYVDRRGMPREVAERVHDQGGASQEETWRAQREHAVESRRLDYSEHKELPLGLIVPMRADVYDTDEDGTSERHSVLRITRIEVNPELPESVFDLQIPEGAQVADFTFDPMGIKAVNYEWSAEMGQPEPRQLLSADEALHMEFERRRRTAERMGSTAPALSGVTWISEEQVNLEDLRGSHVLLVFMSASFPPCELQAETLGEWAEMLPELGVRLVGVFTAWDAPDDVRSFARAHGLEFPICICTPDGPGPGGVFEAYGVTAPLGGCLVGPDGNLIDQDQASAGDLLAYLAGLREARRIRAAQD